MLRLIIYLTLAGGMTLATLGAERDAAISNWAIQRIGEARSPLEGKLKRLVLPEVIVDGVTVKDLLVHLRRQARELDPDGEGFNLFFKAKPAALQAKLSMDVKDIPVSELLRYIEMTTDLQFVYERHAVVVEDKEEQTVDE